jgi:hypothetical protein
MVWTSSQGSAGGCPWGGLRGRALRLLLGVPCAARGCGRGEQTPALLRGRPFPDELEEDAPRRPAPGPVLGEHPAARLTRQRVREDGAAALPPQDPQHRREQWALGLLEGRSQGVNGHGVHTCLSC